MLNQKIQLELDYFPNKQNSDNDYLCFVVVANKPNKDSAIKSLENHRLYIPINNNKTTPNKSLAMLPQTNTTDSPNEAPDTRVSKDTVRWLQQIAVTTLKNLESHNFNAEFLAIKMNLSLRQLHRKLKQLTGLNPTQYLREARLQQARILLENQTYPMIKMVCYKVGMRDPKYFSRQFKKRFGQSPSIYLD